MTVTATRPTTYASRPTAPIASESSSSTSWQQPSNRLSREFLLLRDVTSGLFLAGVMNGQLQWSADPAAGVRSLLVQTLRHNLQSLKDIYNVPDVEVVCVRFISDLSRPGVWVPA